MWRIVLAWWLVLGCGGNDTKTADAPPPVDADVPPGKAMVTVTVAGTGHVMSEPAGIDCPGTCSALFDRTTLVRLSAATANGSGYAFRSWSTPPCSMATASERSCGFFAYQGPQVTATFAPIDHNLVFATSAGVATNLTDAASYDAACNQAATTAGINSASGDAYVAWVSIGGSSPVQRLGNARGFRAVDGDDFADDLAGLLAQRRVLHPIVVDENGKRYQLRGVFTNTNADGTPWSGSGQLFGGMIAGPIWWTQDQAQTGIASASIYCFMRTLQTPLEPPPTVPGAKRIFLSHEWTAAAGTPDAQCNTDRPTGASSARALIARAGAAASTLLDPNTTYVRPDGYIVGTGQQITIAGTGAPSMYTHLDTGIWQQGDGTYVGPSADAAVAWIGSLDISTPGTTGETCQDWTSSSVSDGGRTGYFATTYRTFWQSTVLATCDGQVGHARLYCVEN